MAACTHSLVIIGGGIVGAACALALARAGRRPWVIEAHAPGTGATAEGMGHVLALDHDRATLALTRRSLELWHALAPELPAAAEWSGAGSLWLAQDEVQLEAARARLPVLREAGLEAELVGPRRLCALEPCVSPELRGALRVAEDRIVYPPVVAAWMLARAQVLGATLVTGVAVERLEHAPGEPASVRLADGRELVSERVIVAAGLASAALLGAHPLAKALRPRRGHLVITERAPFNLDHQLVELGYHDSVATRGETSVAFNLQPRASGQLLLGSSRQDGSAGREVEPEILARMVERSRLFVPGLAELNALRAWVGLRPATPDGLALIGPLAPGSPLILACGHEGLGITTSLATAELVLAALGGPRARLEGARAFDPSRAFALGAHRAA